MNNFCKTLTVVLALLLVGSAMAVEIDAVSFKPEKAPKFRGALKKNQELRDNVSLLANNQLSGPEDVAVAADGSIFTGTNDGWVKRVWPDGSVENFAFTGGHPLGMDMAPDGRLIVCEPFTGLLAIDMEGNIEVLATEANGVPFKLADDVKVSASGVAYFTDASSKFNLTDFEYDILENRGHGRLMSYDLVSGELKVLASGLFFANGVAFPEDEAFVLVAETARYQIRRVWLQGDRAGDVEVLMSNLPGSPDGISWGEDGNVWIAFYAPRSVLIDALQPLAKVKNFLARLPKSLLPAPKPYGFVAKYDLDGNPLVSYHDQKGSVIGPVTAVEEVDGVLYLGSLVGAALGRFEP